MGIPTYVSSICNGLQKIWREVLTMNTFSADVDRDLDSIICEKMNYEPAVSKLWMWRIQNEYPEELKNLVRSWASNETLLKVEYNDVSLERILNGTSLNFLEAVDLLYILYKDPAAGYDIFSRSLRRDARRGR